MTPFEGRWARRISKQTRFTFILFEVVAVLITGSALLDQAFGLGWGYEWKDLFMGLGIGLAGGVVYAACRAMFHFMGVER